MDKKDIEKTIKLLKSIDHNLKVNSAMLLLIGSKMEVIPKPINDTDYETFNDIKALLRQMINN